MISFKFENITFTVAPGVTHINIRRPDGKTDTVYPFRYVPTRFDYDIEGNEMMYQNGKETMRCRYTPDFEGDATIEICSSETNTLNLFLFLSDIARIINGIMQDQTRKMLPVLVPYFFPSSLSQHGYIRRLHNNSSYMPDYH